MKLEDIKVGAKIIWNPPLDGRPWLTPSQSKCVDEVGEVCGIHTKIVLSNSSVHFRVKYDNGIEIEFAANDELLKNKVFTLATTANAIVGQPAHVSPHKEEKNEDWRLWAHNVPGECKCGIPVKMCTYHK